MRRVYWSIGCVVGLLVGCGGVAFTTPPDGGGGGLEAGGGGTDSGGGGDSGSGGSDSGGSADASDSGSRDATGTCATGSIQFVMEVASNSASNYCSGTPGGCAGGVDWLSIRPLGGGAALTLSGSCMTDCTACQPVLCPLLCAAPTRVPPGGEKTTWNGTVYDSSTCGAGTSCVSPACVAPGSYVARMCGFAETGSDASTGSCVGSTTSTTSTCVDVRFDWPPAGGSAVVTGTLGAPTIDSGACCPSGWDLYDCAYSDGGAGLACHDPSKACASSTTCGQGCDTVVMGRCNDGG